MPSLKSRGVLIRGSIRLLKTKPTHNGALLKAHIIMGSTSFYRIILLLYRLTDEWKILRNYDVPFHLFVTQLSNNNLSIITCLEKNQEVKPENIAGILQHLSTLRTSFLNI
jgi:hypothetical protein